MNGNRCLGSQCPGQRSLLFRIGAVGSRPQDQSPDSPLSRQQGGHQPAPGRAEVDGRGERLGAHFVAGDDDGGLFLPDTVEKGNISLREEAAIQC